MGIIDNLKNVFNGNKQNKIKPSKYVGIPQNEFYIEREDGTQAIFYPKGVKYNIKHGNGELTKLIAGKIDIVRPDDTLFFDAGAPVCFEIPADMSIEQAVQTGFLESLNYNGHLDNLDYNQYNILGRLVLENERINIVPFSRTVSQLAQGLNQELMKEKEQKILESQRKHQLMLEEEERHRQQISAIEQQEMEQRKNNPYFWERDVKSKNTGVLYSYETVDRNTGEVIILGNVKKLVKDNQSNYVYMGTVQRLLNSIYHMPDELGWGVVFSSAYKLEEIAQSQNPALIDRISHLLTVNNLEDKELNYLGQLTRQGDITRQLWETSPETQNYVKQLQEEYNLRHNQQRNGRQYPEIEI